VPGTRLSAGNIRIASNVQRSRTQNDRRCRELQRSVHSAAIVSDSNRAWWVHPCPPLTFAPLCHAPNSCRDEIYVCSKFRRGGSIFQPMVDVFNLLAEHLALLAEPTSDHCATADLPHQLPRALQMQDESRQQGFPFQLLLAHCDIMCL
jgi:hypothetical protein